eukprot:1043142-Amphidinium_carterae.2
MELNQYLGTLHKAPSLATQLVCATSQESTLPMGPRYPRHGPCRLASIDRNGKARRYARARREPYCGICKHVGPVSKRAFSCPNVVAYFMALRAAVAPTCDHCCSSRRAVRIHE